MSEADPDTATDVPLHGPAGWRREPLLDPAAAEALRVAATDPRPALLVAGGEPAPDRLLELVPGHACARLGPTVLRSLASLAARVASRPGRGRLRTWTQEASRRAQRPAAG